MRSPFSDADGSRDDGSADLPPQDDGATPRVPWWGALLVVIQAVVGMYLALGAAAWLRSVTGELPFGTTFQAVQEDLVSLAFAQVLGFGAAIVGALRVFGAPRAGDAAEVGLASHLEALGLRALSAREFFAALVAGVALQLVLAEVGNLAMLRWPIPLEDRLRLARMVSPASLAEALPLLLAVVLVAPLMEELLFRGVVLRGVAGQHGRVAAVLLSSLLFGAAHMIPAAVVFAGVGGLVFAWVVLRTGTVSTTLVMHTAVNATPLLLPERLVRIPGFNTTRAEIEHLPLPILLGAAMVLVLALALVIRPARRS